MDDDYESPVRKDPALEEARKELAKVREELKKAQALKQKTDFYFENELARVKDENTKLLKIIEEKNEQKVLLVA